MNWQSIQAKKGEIEFRRKLVRQQVDGEKIFDDEFNRTGIEKILKERMEKTLRQMRYLKDNEKVLFDPICIEIGAERCQRSLVIENDLGVMCAAIDISYDMLKSCDYYKAVYNKSRMHFRICCDVTSLPIKSDSVTFVFCYETLHHFPYPALATEEVHRVLLPGGHFFFDEEGYKRVLHVNLYRSKKIYSREKLRAGIFKKVIDYFFAIRSCNEIEHGIIENDSISIDDWKDALKLFDKKNIILQTPIRAIKTELFHPKSLLKYILAYLIGGNISGLCQKKGSIVNDNISIYKVLICPECFENKTEANLVRNKFGFKCKICNSVFPVMDDVLFLFSQDKLREFYPEIYRTMNNMRFIDENGARAF